MALITCPECNKQISDQLNTVCPSCGYVHDKNSVALISAQNRTQLGWFFVILFMGILSIILGLFMGAMLDESDGGIFATLTQSGLMIYTFLSAKKYTNKFNKIFTVILGLISPLYAIFLL